MNSRVAPIALASAVLLTVAGCSATAAPRAHAAGLGGSITVDAASSLTGTFDAVGAAFEKANPGVTVVFNYGGSGTLVASIVAGAPVDVFAAASPTTMATLTKAGLVAGTPRLFVKNQLEIAVPKGNPGGITGIHDFADASKKIALCAPAQPCGAAATAVFGSAHITAKPDTLEPDVKSAVTKVALDEVDAAMVYHTDVITAGSAVQGIPFPESAQFIVGYPIAAVKGNHNSALAAAFVKFVREPMAQKILSDAGFLAP